MGFQILPALAAWLLILPAAFLSGSVLKRWYDTEDDILNGVLACSLGFAVLSFGVVVMSYSFGLSRVAIWVLVGFCAAVRIRALSALGNWFRLLGREIFLPYVTDSIVLPALSWISILGLFFACLTPEIGGDALVYHLNLPKVFLAQGSINPIFEDLNSYFPLFMSNLYLIGLATGGVLSAKLFSFSVGVLFFLAVHRVVLIETGQKSIAFAAGLIVLLTPVFYNLLSTTYVDPALAFYTFLSVFLFARGFYQEREGAFFASGLFLGCAISTKYLTVMAVLAFGGLWVWQLIRLKKGRIWFKRFSLWGLGIMITGGFWILRNWILLKNPIFPYLSSVFGTTEMPGSHWDIYGTGKSLGDFVFLFWNLFQNPSAFGAFSDRTGIFYLLALPFVVLAFFRAPRSRPYTLFSIVFLILWFFVGQHNRYLVPVLPVFLVAGTLGVASLMKQEKVKGWVSKAIGLISVAGITVYLLGGLYHYRYAAFLHLGIWKPAQYLNNLERTIPIADWVNANLPQEAKILFAVEPRQYYFNRPLVRDVFLKYRTNYPEQYQDPESLAAFLKSEGVSHFLLSRPLSDQDKVALDPLLHQLAESPYAEEIYAVDSRNIRDAKYHYELYEIR